MARTRLSLIPRRDQTSAVEVWEEEDGSIVTYQDGKPLVAATIDQVTGVNVFSIEGIEMSLPNANPNTLYLMGDSLTAMNYQPSVITAASIAAGTLTVTVSSAHQLYAGARFRMVNTVDSAGKDITGEYVSLSRPDATHVTATAISGSTDGACVPTGGYLYNKQMLPDYGPVNWLNILSKQKFEVVGMSAGGGWTLTRMLAAVDEAIASGAKNIWVAGGTNDLNNGIISQGTIASSVSSASSLLSQIYTKLLNAGRTVLAANVPPMGTGVPNVTFKTAGIIALNKFIFAAGRLSPGVRVIDQYGAIVDPVNATPGTPLAGTQQGDWLHWTAKGAYQVGVVANAATADIPLYDDRVCCNADNYGTNAVSTNLLDSAPWTNTGGTVADVIVNTNVGAGYTVTSTGNAGRIGTATATASTNGYAQKVTFNAAAANDTVSISTIAGTGGAVNARTAPNTPYRYDSTVSVTAAAAGAISGLDISSKSYIDGGTVIAASGLYPSGTTFPAVDWSGVVRTPYFQWSGALTNSLNFNATATCSGVGTGLVLAVERVACRKAY